jgi:hypothetical protein
MNDYFEKNNMPFEASYVAIGGLSIDAVPYLLPQMIQLDDEIVILEIATSWFSLTKKTQEQADFYLKLIVDLIQSRGLKLIFLNLYRRDIDDEDVVVKAISKIGFEKYPILDFKKYYRDLLTSSGSDGTIDGVHPNQDVIATIAEKICNFVNKNINELKALKSEVPNPSICKIISLDGVNEPDYLFKHSGLELKAKVLKQDEYINFSMNEEAQITGLFYLYGPDTNQIELKMDDFSINIKMRDENSFYRRLGYRALSPRLVKNITIYSPNELVDVKLRKEPHEKSESIKNYIVGFSCLQSTTIGEKS